jgi:hypothetical protein
MKPFKKWIVAGLFTSAALSTFAQDINQEKFTQNYKEACVRHQAQLHEKLKEVSADSFGEYCDCTARKLLMNLNPDQITELTQGRGRPTWLKAAEKSASKACIKEGPGIRT